MKVLLFTSHYPASDSPTRGTYNRNTLGALAKHCEARVVGAISFWYRKHNRQHLFRAQREDGFRLDASFVTYWTIPLLTPMHAAAMYARMYPLLREAMAPLTRLLGRRDVERCVVGSGELLSKLKARAEALGPM